MEAGYILQVNKEILITDIQEVKYNANKNMSKTKALWHAEGWKQVTHKGCFCLLHLQLFFGIDVPRVRVSGMQ